MEAHRNYPELLDAQMPETLLSESLGVLHALLDTELYISKIDTPSSRMIDCSRYSALMWPKRHGSLRREVGREDGRGYVLQGAEHLDLVRVRGAWVLQGRLQGGQRRAALACHAQRRAEEPLGAIHAVRGQARRKVVAELGLQRRCQLQDWPQQRGLCGRARLRAPARNSQGFRL